MKKMMLLIFFVLLALSACGQSKFTTDQLVADSLSTNGTTWVNEFSTDGLLGGNSDRAVPTEKAVKTYVDGVAHDTAGIGIRIASIIDDTSKYVNRYDTAAWATGILQRVTSDDTVGIGVRIASIIDDTSKYVNRYDTATWAVGILDRETDPVWLDDSSSYLTLTDTTNNKVLTPHDTLTLSNRINLKSNTDNPTFTTRITTPALVTGTGKVQIDSIVKSGTDIKFYEGATALNAVDDDTVTIFDVVDKSPLQEIQAMGSTVKSLPIMFSIPTGELVDTLADGRAYFIAFYIPRTTVITGVKWWTREQGVYTANNDNVVALYKESAGTLTKVDSCANDGNLWKAGSWTLATKAFTATYSASAGIYYVSLLLNYSAKTTEPKLYLCTDDVGLGFEFTNNNKLHGFIAAQATLPHTVALSDVSALLATGFIIWLY